MSKKLKRPRAARAYVSIVDVWDSTVAVNVFASAITKNPKVYTCIEFGGGIMVKHIYYVLQPINVFVLSFSHLDIQCVETMQSNCQKLKLPFEVLIQGPSGNRFVRSLLSYDPQHMSHDDDMPAEDDEQRKTRSTISIYRPEEELDETVQNLEAESDLDSVQASKEPASDMVTMAHQTQSDVKQTNTQASHEQLILTLDDDIGSEAQSANEEDTAANHKNHSNSEDDAEMKSAGNKRQAVFDIDVAMDGLYEESDLIKRQAGQEEGEPTAPATDGLVAAIKDPLLDVPVPAPAPAPAPVPAPTKPQLARDAVIRTKSKIQELKENAAQQRAKFAGYVTDALEGVKTKLNNAKESKPLILSPIIPAAAPVVAPAAAPVVAPVVPEKKPLFKNWLNNMKNEDTTVGNIQNLNLLPTQNIIPLQFNKLNNKVIVTPGGKVINPATQLRVLSNNIAARKAQAQAAINNVNKANRQANLLPLVSASSI